MKRRQFITLLGGAAAAWPLAAQSQQPAMPVVGFLHPGWSAAFDDTVRAFHQGLRDIGYVPGENVAIEYRWAEGQIDQLPELAAELVRRQVALIAAPQSGVSALKAATTTIPIVFIAGDDPVRLGLVASLARPGGNVTGINFFVQEIVSKRLALLHELVPKAVRIAVLVNPGNAAAAKATLDEAREAAPAMGLQIAALNASTVDEIDAAFAAIARERADALLVAADGFLNSRRGQFAILAARDRLPMSAATREAAEAGSLMSYGTNLNDTFRQVGIYAGSIVKGAKPDDLPVLQSTKFEFVINLQTARALGLEVPPTLLARADEVIE